MAEGIRFQSGKERPQKAVVGQEPHLRIPWSKVGPGLKGSFGVKASLDEGFTQNGAALEPALESVATKE